MPLMVRNLVFGNFNDLNMSRISFILKYIYT